MMILFIFCFQVTAQIAKKNDPGTKSEGTGAITDTKMEKTTFSTSRLEDIQEINDYQRKLEEAIETKKFETAQLYKNKAMGVMTNEIARAKKNLKELKAGDTKHLEEYQKKNAPNYPINVDREINNLQNRINYEIQVYKALSNLQISKDVSERELTMNYGYVNGFKRAMERNLRYDSDNKDVSVPGGSSSTKGDQSKGGSGSMTKKGSKEKIDTDDPRLQSWMDSKKQRMADFEKHGSEFKKYADQNNDNMARRSYQALVQLMMDEINASNWLIGQINSGNIKKGSYDTKSLSGKVQKQQSILEEARTIKVSTPETLKANKSNASELFNKFINTLK